MKKYLKSLFDTDNLCVSFIKNSLYAVAFCAATLLLYCAVLKSRGQFSLRQGELVKNSLEYVAASLSLGISFGLLIDIAVKKGQ